MAFLDDANLKQKIELLRDCAEAASVWPGDTNLGVLQIAMMEVTQRLIELQFDEDKAHNKFAG